LRVGEREAPTQPGVGVADRQSPMTVGLRRMGALSALSDAARGALLPVFRRWCEGIWRVIHSASDEAFCAGVKLGA
jgi:hypothetical protein